MHKAVSAEPGGWLARLGAQLAVAASFFGLLAIDSMAPVCRRADTELDGESYAKTYTWFLELRKGQLTNASAFFNSIASSELWTRVKPEMAR